MDFWWEDVIFGGRSPAIWLFRNFHFGFTPAPIVFTWGLFLYLFSLSIGIFKLSRLWCFYIPLEPFNGLYLL